MSEIGSGNGSSYPNSIDTNNIPEVNSPSPSRTKARAEVVNDLGACVVATETELGINPSGTKTNVKDYLQTEHNTDGTHDEAIIVTLTAAQTLTNKTLTSPTINGGTLSGVSGSFTVRDLTRDLIIIPNGSDPTFKVDIDASEVAVQDTSFGTALLNTVNLTVDIEDSVGINALDTGTEAADTWYYLWVIYNGTITAGLLSLSSTAPTMPSGYTFKALVGAVRNDNSSNFIPFQQEENRVFYDAPQSIQSGSLTTGAWTALSGGSVITNFYPVTAKMIKGFMGATNAGVRGFHFGLSPRSDGGAGDYHTMETDVGTTSFGGILPSVEANWIPLETRYAATVYYWTNEASADIVAQGWEY